MGNQTTAANVSSLPVCQPSQPGEWQKEGTTGYCDLVRNRKTGQLAEQYVFQRDQRLDVLEDCLRYEFRRQQRNGIVEVYQVERENAQQYMCRGDETIRVRTERIVRRLADRDNDISQQQAISILKQALQGYSVIAAKYGPVRLNDEMIGFTPDGRAKVWLNEDFWRNAPDDISEIFASRRKSNEFNPHKAMLEQLLDSLEGHARPPGFGQDFRQGYKQAAANGNFEEVVAFVNRYASGHSGHGLLTGPAVESATTIVQQLGSNQQILMLSRQNPQPTTVYTSIRESPARLANAQPSPKVSLQLPPVPLQLIQSIPATTIDPAATSIVQYMSPSRATSSPQKYNVNAVSRNNNFIGGQFSIPFKQPVTNRNLSLGRSAANTGLTSRNLSLNASSSRLITNHLLKALPPPATTVATSPLNQTSQLRTFRQKPMTTTNLAPRTNNQASNLRMNLSVGRLQVPFSPYPNKKNSLSRQVLLTPNLNKSMHVSNPTDNTASMVSLSGFHKPIGTRTSVNNALPITFAYGGAVPQRRNIVASGQKNIKLERQPQQIQQQQLPSQPFLKPQPKPQKSGFATPKQQQSLATGQVNTSVTANEYQFPRTSDADNVTPQTLFEERPPTAERNQIKIVYEDQQLDAYTLDNLTKQIAMPEMPYQQPPSTNFKKPIQQQQEPTIVQSIKQQPIHNVVQQQPVQHVVQQQPAQQIIFQEQPVAQHTFPICVDTPPEQVVMQTITVKQETVEPLPAFVTITEEAESRPVVFKQSLPHITFNIGGNYTKTETIKQEQKPVVLTTPQIQQQTATTVVESVIQQQANVRVLQPIKVEVIRKDEQTLKQPAIEQPRPQPIQTVQVNQPEVVEQRPQQPSAKSPTGNTGGLRYEQISTEYQQQYLNQLQEYKRRQEQALQEEQQRRDREWANTQALVKAQLEAERKTEQEALVRAAREAQAIKQASQKRNQAYNIQQTHQANSTVAYVLSSENEIKVISQPQSTPTVSSPYRIENITHTLKLQESPPKRICNEPTFIPAVSNRVIVQPTIYERLSEDSISQSQYQQQHSSSPPPTQVTQEVEIIQQHGRPVGYEVVETDVYYTPEGDKITVQEDYQVVYDQQGRARVIDTNEQYPINEDTPIQSVGNSEGDCPPQFGGNLNPLRLNESPTAVHYGYNTQQQQQAAYDETVDPVSPIIHLANCQSINFEGGNRAKFSLNPSAVQQDQNARSVEYASSLKYSSGLMSSGVASDVFFSQLRDEVAEDLPSYGNGVPTYEGLRAELLDNYSNITGQGNHRNALYSARIETTETYSEEQYEPTIPLPPQQATYSSHPS